MTTSRRSLATNRRIRAKTSRLEQFYFHVILGCYTPKLIFTFVATNMGCKMRRFGHGESTRASAFRNFSTSLSAFRASVGLDAEGSRFGYMFEGLQEDPANRLPPTPATVLALKQLAKTMTDMPEQLPGSGQDGPGDSEIPAAYTYFGQFLDHDITFDRDGLAIELLADPALQPLPSLNGLRNTRSSTIDLDSVYAVPAAARNGDRLVVGPVTPLNGETRPLLRPAGKGDLNDLPRQARNPDPGLDRAAIIGDPRNDENTIVAQLHTAFLKAHDSLVDEGRDFETARRDLILRYQAIVLNDFMRKVCDPAVVDDVLANGPRFWRVGSPGHLFMPVEFSVAAYRFGHSMVRKQYDFNVNFTKEFIATFDELFSFTALSGQIGEVVVPGGFDTLTENWIIEWERFLPLGSTPPQKARLIDPRLTDQLFQLRNTFGLPEGGEFPAGSQAQQLAPKLAMRNLLRGYLFGLPTGQAVARLLNAEVLEGASLLAALPTAAMKTSAEPFAQASPLWFYVLAEAGNPAGPGGRHLGPVGSRIVAETLWNLVKHSSISILDGADHTAIANFTLPDLINLAGRQDAAAA
jgi:heme peroxidase